MKLQLKLYNEGGTLITNLSNQITITSSNYNTIVNNVMTPSDSVVGTRYAKLSVIRESGDSFLVSGNCFTTQLRKVSTDAVHVENYLVSHNDIMAQNLNVEYRYLSQKLLDTSITNFQFRYYADEPAPECIENFDCPDGEKCVEGECVPCDDQSATHFQVRFEYEELVTTSDANQVMSTLSSIYPIEGSEGQIIQGQETSGLWYYPRIRFCDGEGEARPYTGALAFYGYCNPDGSTALYSNNSNLTEKSWVIGQKARTDSVSANPWSVPRLLIEFIETSKIVYEVRCSGVDPSEFPPIDPVEPTEPDEPLPPDPGDPPDEIDEPLPPDPVDGTGGGEPPPEPQEGLCDCEKYLAKMILAGTQQIRNAIVEHGNQLDARLADGHTVLYERITSLERVLFQQHKETNRLLYELSMFLFQPYFTEIVLIRKTLQKSLESGDDGLIDIVKTGLVEGEEGLIDIAKDFIDQYEPVTIENEYRTQSHRVIDNLDEVVNKL